MGRDAMDYFQKSLFSEEEELKYNSYVGKKIGALKVILFVGYKERIRNDLAHGIGTRRLKNYLCKCNCGETVEKDSHQLYRIKKGEIVSHCQGVKHRSPCQTGDVIGDLKVIDIIEKNVKIGDRALTTFEKSGNWKIVCRCLICNREDVVKKFGEWNKYKRLIKKNPKAYINCGCSHPAFKKGYRSKLKPNTFSHLYKQLKNVEYRAKRENIPFNLDIEYFIDKDNKPDGQKTGYPEYCPIFGTKLNHIKGSDNMASFDKVIPEHGYIKGNVQIISYKANRLKSNLHLSDFKNFLEYIENNTIVDNNPSKINFIQHIATGWGSNSEDIDWQVYR